MLRDLHTAQVKKITGFYIIQNVTVLGGGGWLPGKKLNEGNGGKKWEGGEKNKKKSKRGNGEQIGIDAFMLAPVSFYPMG